MAVDLHPDIVKAINNFAATPLGRKFGRYAKSHYGVSGKKLLAKQTAAEFGGRSTKTGRGVVSSAGARGPAQFIPDTRAGYMSQYHIDPWRSDKEAFKGMAIHDMGTGVAGYNPGMPSYTGLVLGQKINPEDIKALRTGGGGGGSRNGRPHRPGAPEVSMKTTTTPTISHAPERQALRRSLLLGPEGISLKTLLAYHEQKAALGDEPGRSETTTEIKPGQAHPGKGHKIYDHLADRNGVPQGYKGKKGGIYEIFYDPEGKYWDAGGTHPGGIGGHSDHVHLSADRGYVVKIGHFAQRLGLHVGEHPRFGGVAPVHTGGSFHYRKEAIDVSGPPNLMKKFARIMLNEARHGHGR